MTPSWIRILPQRLMDAQTEPEKVLSIPSGFLISRVVKLHGTGSLTCECQRPAQAAATISASALHPQMDARRIGMSVTRWLKSLRSQLRCATAHKPVTGVFQPRFRTIGPLYPASQQVNLNPVFLRVLALNPCAAVPVATAARYAKMRCFLMRRESSAQDLRLSATAAVSCRR
jgi:hypothetical protein